MIKYLATLGILLSGIFVSMPAGAAASYCGTTAYDLHYRAIFEYPTGTYWQHQIAKYGDYYSSHNSYYQAKYGC